MLRAVFCGTAPFAVPSLRACAQRTALLAVITQPDRPGDRGRPAPRPVADLARDLGVEVRQPPRIRDATVVEEVLGLAADVLVVAAYGQIIPRSVLDGHRLGGVNVHASLLPRWRGAAPINHAILAGDDRTGVCIMRMEAGLDTGPVYTCAELALDAESTAPTVTARLAEIGATLLVTVLDELEQGRAHTIPQDSARHTLAPRLGRGDGEVEWASETAAGIDRRLRALQPWPGVSVVLGGQRVRLVAGSPVGGETEPGEPGSVAATHADGVDVITAGGAFRVRRVQPPGGREMDAAAYLRGRRPG